MYDAGRRRVHRRLRPLPDCLRADPNRWFCRPGPAGLARGTWRRFRLWRSGSLYVTTHPAQTLVRIDPSGYVQRSLIARRRPKRAGSGTHHALIGPRYCRAFAIRRTLDEDQIFRIDHFLGKDTVQNIMAFVGAWCCPYQLGVIRDLARDRSCKATMLVPVPIVSHWRNSMIFP